MKNKAKDQAKHPPGKEDSIDVSLANAGNRFSITEAKKGITKSGGNASADVKKQSSKK